MKLVLVAGAVLLIALIGRLIGVVHLKIRRRGQLYRIMKYCLGYGTRSSAIFVCPDETIEGFFAYLILIVVYYLIHIGF